MLAKLAFDNAHVDATSRFGVDALAAAANTSSPQLTNITTAGTNSTLTAAQALSGCIVLASGASGGFTITLPSTAAIMSALPRTIPVDGTFCMWLIIQNNNVGQTGTLTAGDASTTITGTATISTNTVREYLLQVTAATTITITNMGSKTL